MVGEIVDGGTIGMISSVVLVLIDAVLRTIVCSAMICGVDVEVRDADCERGLEGARATVLSDTLSRFFDFQSTP